MQHCLRCGTELQKSTVEGYTYYCPNCDEDFYKFEQQKSRIEICPNCGSSNTQRDIEYSAFAEDGEEYNFDAMYCKDCKTAWANQFKRIFLAQTNIIRKGE